MDGMGARLNGGRWNPVGCPAVYLADSRALAALEILVHADRDTILLDWSVIEVELPDRLIDKIDLEDLPLGWNVQPNSMIARRLGGEWLTRKSNLGLRVPSAVISEEFTVVLNPMHKAAMNLKISEPRVFPFDKRLVGRL